MTTVQVQPFMYNKLICINAYMYVNNNGSVSNKEREKEKKKEIKLKLNHVVPGGRAASGISEGEHPQPPLLTLLIVGDVCGGMNSLYVNLRNSMRNSSGFQL